MALDYTNFNEKAVYTLYQVYDSIVKEFERKEILDADERVKLANAKQAVNEIEEYTKAKRAEGLRWSLPSLFQANPSNRTLILELYPGSDGYKKYGKEVVDNIEYDEEDLRFIIESIRNKAPRVVSTLKFKIVPEFTDETLSTGDIFGIQ